MFHLTISPPQTEIVIKPGSSFTQAYQITNNSNQSVYLSTHLKEWLPQDNQFSIFYLDQPTPHLKFSLLNANLALGQDFILKPNQSQQLVLKVNVLPNADLQDYYFTFFISQIDISAPNITSATAQIGAHLLISTSTDLNPQPKYNLKSLVVSPTVKDVFFTNLSFHIELENQTDYFQKPTGNLVIQKSGKDFKSLPLDSQNILANHSRLIGCLDNQSCTISGPFWPGPYTATIKLDNYTSPPQTFVILPLSPMAIFLLIITFYHLYHRFYLTKFTHPKRNDKIDN